MEEKKKKNKSKGIKFNNNVIESENNTLKNTFLKTTGSKSISQKANSNNTKDNISKDLKQNPNQRKLTSSKSMKEFKTIEKSLLMSLEKSEKLDNEKLKLADEINFRGVPDKIMDTDEFGFIKESNDNKKQDKESLLQLNARLEKWNYMLSNFDDFAKNHYSKLKERVRKGIPDSLRGYVWQKILNVDEDFYKKDLYQKLNEESGEPSIEEVIIKDIDRTFPKNTFFNQKYGGGQRSLYKVLANYSKYNKEVGYVQGMGFITALLLTYMDEERSFFMLHALMKKRELETLYLPGFPDLNKKLYVFLNLQKKLIPKIYCTFKKFDIVPFTYSSEWFLCLFSRSLKFNSLVRIFDTFILEGYKVIYRFALAFLKSKEHKIIECKEMDSLFKEIKSCFENVDIEEIMKIAFGFHLSKKEIENFEKEYDKNKNNKKNEFVAQL
jgi:hypothetical protein